MIKIKDLKVWIWDKEILKWINMNFELWKNYCLLWKNGSGKSTLSSFLMWHPKYECISWSVDIEIPLSQPFPKVPHPNPLPMGEGIDQKGAELVNLLDLTPEERSKAWLFLSFQNVPEIKGIKLSEYLRIIYNIANPNIVTPTGSKWMSPFLFKRFVKKYLEELSMDEKFLDRELNVWFSWWEKRKIEILQMKLIWPKYIILDEIDSWLDIDAFRKVAELLKSIDNENNSLIIITHYFKILEYINVDEVYILKDWMIVEKWWKELIEKVKKNWYE